MENTAVLSHRVHEAAPVDRTVSRKAPLCRTEPVRREVTKRRHVTGSKTLHRFRICHLRSKCVARTYVVEGENELLQGEL